MHARGAWTLMFYMNADSNDLSSAARDTFAALAAYGSTAEVNLVAQIDIGTEGRGVPGLWDNALRFHILPGMEGTAFEALPGFHSDVNMGDGRALADFVYWSTTEFPADHYALVIWGHGQGYVLKQFDLGTDLGYALERVSSQMAVIETALTQPTLLHTVAYSRAENDPLYLKEIRDRLLEMLPTRLELIAFDSCCMATTEAAYALREVAECMVASEEVVEGAGLAYEWVRLLQAQAGQITSGLDLGKLIVASEDARSRSLPDPAVKTMSAVDLRSIDALAESIDRLVDAVESGGAAALDAVRAARNRCSPFSVSNGPGATYAQTIDLQHLIDRLAEEPAAYAARAAGSDVKLAAQKAVVSSFARDSLRASPFGASGISIYFPASARQFRNDIYHPSYVGSDAATAVQFSNEHRWLNLLFSVLDIAAETTSLPESQQKPNQGGHNMAKTEFVLDDILREKRALQQQAAAAPPQPVLAFDGGSQFVEDENIPQFCRCWGPVRAELDRMRSQETADARLQEDINVVITRMDRQCVGLRQTPAVR
jgi:hypothetical protein